MLRKDVKLGFAIGGVMLAVVVVYVLVVPNNERKSPVVVDESQANSSPSSVAPSPAKSDAVASDQKAGETKATDSGDVKPDNVGESKSSVAISGEPTTAPTVAAKGDVWDLALRDGVLPPSMSSTPTGNSGNSTSGNSTSGNATSAGNASGPSDQKPSEKPTDKQSSMQTSMLGNQPDAAIADAGAGDAINDTKPADAKPADDKLADVKAPEAKLAGDTETKSSSGHDTSHVVKAGETLSSIAAASYGDSKSWKLIAAANPTVNPNRLAAGTKLIIPAGNPTSGATSGVTASRGAVVASKIDPKSEYQVQSNDSLYRISMRLYGTGEHATKLYEDNKEIIGANPARLKLGMILKLTDPPSMTTARAS